ncbi:transcription termination/antitermination protein NusA [Mycoplasma capricolum subsp. capripneumoniae]|uniref:Transcription termination/antitermination protein NusA n=1 Tax=Mycoplasma capricolum subsp. capripneumoniae 87001 TaxID=1124992 RepID=A0A9N7BJ36_MYCCC|nr:transcription termination factor NusA [Mycoplasma capricolum]AJK51375.1 transcription elongation factor NusA [Mycoplasma capricolum subsp. capripneumoniae 87001]AOQ22061.1 transcription termination/antitermination protein NusA [Mycoplasma capricolum subsp. capripneumoniae M1601]AQU77454.1 transcription termination/antitermination protein NusA [Mycoplasma capricolum subsp. capripneumoniae]KEY84189.1 Transcriptional terminator [Mycoplasma capricolum subsp. capripneumoniae 99108]QDL19535.1 tra
MLNGTELLESIKLIEKEKGISKESIINGLKEGLQKAYERFYDTDAIIKIDINEKTGSITMHQELKVVEKLDDDWLEITLQKAKLQNPDAQIGDIIYKPIEFSEEFSRMVVNQVRQIFQQKIREAERARIYEQFISLEGEVVQAKVVGMNRENNYILDINGTTAYLWKNKTINNEIFQINEIIDVYIEVVEKESKLSQIAISRTVPAFLTKLIEREVPEVRMGIVEIKGVSREPGKRSKVAVVTHNQNIEPIGAIIGVGGNRINRISDILKGEKIDVIRWSDDQITYLINAMTPVKVISINKIGDEYDIVVPDSQLSLAIGKQGITAKLIASLLKTKINIFSYSIALKENMDILWNGDTTKQEVETNSYIPKTKISKKEEKIVNTIIKKPIKKKEENIIDVDALMAFQAEVEQEQDAKIYEEINQELTDDKVQPDSDKVKAVVNVIKNIDDKITKVEIKTDDTAVNITTNNNVVTNDKLVNDEIKTEAKPNLTKIEVSKPNFKKQKHKEELNIDFNLENEPDIDEIDANLKAFNDAILKQEDEEDIDIDSLDDYDKYYD